MPSAFKSSRYFLQQFTDGQMLRADLLALAAAYARAGFAMSIPRDDAVVHAAVPVMEGLVGVH